MSRNLFNYLKTPPHIGPSLRIGPKRAYPNLEYIIEERSHQSEPKNEPSERRELKLMEYQPEVKNRVFSNERGKEQRKSTRKNRKSRKANRKNRKATRKNRK